MVQHLQQAFEAWRRARLDDKPIVYLLLDAIAVHVRVDGAVQSTPILVALGVTATGKKELLGPQLMASESTAAWKAMVDDLVARGLRAPLLCIIDGNAGLRRAVGETWPQARVQRCVVNCPRFRGHQPPFEGRGVHDAQVAHPIPAGVQAAAR